MDYVLVRLECDWLLDRWCRSPTNNQSHCYAIAQAVRDVPRHTGQSSLLNVLDEPIPRQFLQRILKADVVAHHQEPGVALATFGSSDHLTCRLGQWRQGSYSKLQHKNSQLHETLLIVLTMTNSNNSTEKRIDVVDIIKKWHHKPG